MMLHMTVALLCGAAIALQAALNSSLGRQLGSPLFATVVAFGAGLGFASVAAFVYARVVASPRTADVPTYLWFAGGLLGVLALFGFYWLIPRVGMGVTLSFTVTGQLALGMLASHYGWFDLPRVELTCARLCGAATLLVGAVLVQRG